MVSSCTSCSPSLPRTANLAMCAIVVAVASCTAHAAIIRGKNTANVGGSSYLETVWATRFNTSNTFGPNAMVVVDTGIVVAQTVNLNPDPNRPTFTLSGFDMSTGELRYEVPDGSGGSRSGIVSSHHSTGLVYQVSQSRGLNKPILSAFHSSTGATAWNFTRMVEENYGTMKPQPHVVGDTVYFGLGRLYAINAMAGNELSSVTPYRTIAAPGIASTTLPNGTPVLLYPWLDRLSAYNISAPWDAPPQLWNFSKEIYANRILDRQPIVTPDGATVFVHSTPTYGYVKVRWVGALNATTGELLLNFTVPRNAVPFAATNEAILVLDGPDNSIVTVTAYARGNGTALWTTALGESTVFPNPAQCVTDDAVASILCVVNRHQGYFGTASRNSTVYRLNATTGAGDWNYTTPDGAVQTSGGFAYGFGPVVLASDAVNGITEALMVFADRPNAQNPQLSLRRVLLTAPPVPPPPPPLHSIVIESFTETGCPVGFGTPSTYALGSCTQDTPTTSTLRFCVGETSSKLLQVQHFNASATCNTDPSYVGGFVTGVCYPGVAGGSFKVTQCG